MSRLGVALFLVSIVATGQTGPSNAPRPRDPRQALKALNDLIGSWRATGTPSGTQEEAQKGFWTEEMTWQWQFKDREAWLAVDFAKGKYYSGGELHYLPDRDLYQLTLKTTAGTTVSFAGRLSDRRLTLERHDPATKETQRLAFRFLHPNRFLYSYAVRPEGKTLFQGRYQVGATKEGVAFAGEDSRPQCIVSGGLGKIPVTYQGQTYYVCCGGCRTEFNSDPARYVREYQEKQAKKAKQKAGQGE
jgi:hypothetical protein